MLPGANNYVETWLLAGETLRVTVKERLMKCMMLNLFNSDTEEDSFSGFTVLKKDKDSDH